VGEVRALLSAVGFEEEARILDFYHDGFALSLLRRDLKRGHRPGRVVSRRVLGRRIESGRVKRDPAESLRALPVPRAPRGRVFGRALAFGVLPESEFAKLRFNER